MPDPLGFLLDLLVARANPHMPAPPLPLDQVVARARQHGVELPSWDEEQCEPFEEDTAADALAALRTDLTDALVGEDSTAGREALNRALDTWQARFTLEEELGPDELPGVEVDATTIADVPLPPWYARHPAIPRTALERCPNVLATVLAVASTLLTEATNIHLSGYAERVRACQAVNCRAPFIDAGDAGRRRFCSARCRARQSARDKAWARFHAEERRRA